MRMFSATVMLLLWLLGLALATDEPERGCVNHPVQACPPVHPDTICRCSRVENDTTVICCNINTDFQLKESLACAFQKKEVSQPLQKEGPPNVTKLQLPPVTALHILNSTLEKLDVSTSYFQGLIGLSVTQSHVPRIMGRFPSSVTCVNMSAVGLEYIAPEVFSSVPMLGYLDLSNNNLTHPPTLQLRNTKAYFFIDLSGNPGLNCKMLHAFKVQQNSTVQMNFVNENETLCTGNSDYHWFKETRKISFYELEAIDQIDKQCPHGPDYQCRCFISRTTFTTLGIIQPEEGTSLTYLFTATVDCSGQGLTELPRELPPYTFSLNISNNNITHLDYLGTNPNYVHLMNIYAENNRIESITVLEGSQFIEKFTALNLRNNNIKVIPKYLLSNVFDRNPAPRTVYLGMNRLPCDCSTAQILKVWLLANKHHIIDFEDVLCENFNNMKIVDLDQHLVCVYPRDWTDYIYYIIGLEILLFVLLISKVSYDYWVFKTTGYLPWPASKMPRLPCDWVFEL